MQRVRKGVKKMLVLSPSLRKAWVAIVLFLLAGILIGSGVYISSQPEWTKGADVRLYNEAVAAYRAPPGILPASDWRPPEGPIERAAACFEKAGSESKDKKLKSIAFYNLGTIAGREAYALGQTGAPRVGTAMAVSKLAEAVRNDPANEDAKYNLELLEKLQVAVEEGKAGTGPGYAPGYVDKGY
jgi:hypothetical protein